MEQVLEKDKLPNSFILEQENFTQRLIYNMFAFCDLCLSKLLTQEQQKKFVKEYVEKLPNALHYGKLDSLETSLKELQTAIAKGLQSSSITTTTEAVNAKFKINI